MRPHAPSHQSIEDPKWVHEGKLHLHTITKAPYQAVSDIGHKPRQCPIQGTSPYPHPQHSDRGSPAEPNHRYLK